MHKLHVYIINFYMQHLFVQEPDFLPCFRPEPSPATEMLIETIVRVAPRGEIRSGAGAAVPWSWGDRPPRETHLEGERSNVSDELSFNILHLDLPSVNFFKHGTVHVEEIREVSVDGKQLRWAAGQ